MTQPHPTPNPEDYYAFIRINPSTYHGEYDQYYQNAAKYITNVILLTNTLLLILITCFMELGHEPPPNSMVGTFINRITSRTHPLSELSELVDELRIVNGIVNQVKHSLIGITAHPQEQGVIFFDLQLKQSVAVSADQCAENLHIINMAIGQAQRKLAELQNVNHHPSSAT